MNEVNVSHFGHNQLAKINHIEPTFDKNTKKLKISNKFFNGKLNYILDNDEINVKKYKLHLESIRNSMIYIDSEELVGFERMSFGISRYFCQFDDMSFSYKGIDYTIKVPNFQKFGLCLDKWFNLPINKAFYWNNKLI